MSTQARRDTMATQVVNMTGVSRQMAMQILRKYNYSIDRAVSAIFDGEIPSNLGDKAAVEKIFDQYKDQSTNEIGIDGTLKLLDDLGLDPEDPSVLAVCKECNAPSQGRFTRDNFVKGLTDLGINNFADFKKQAKEMGSKMANDPNYFTQVYRYTFVFNLADGQRILPLDTAIPLWQLLLTDRYMHLDKWVEFVTTEYQKSISKDTWNMLWDFAKYHKDDPKLENYDEEMSWPTVIDEFVEWIKPRL